MAIYETKIVQVENDPETINASNDAWGRFGWNVQGIQVTHSQDTKTYSSAWDQIGGNQSATVETTTINYATITYQRDKKMENYEQIAELERQYIACLSEIEQIQEETAEAQKKPSVLLSIILLVCCWPAAIGYWIYNAKRKETRQERALQAQQEADRKIPELRLRMDRLVEQAEELL